MVQKNVEEYFSTCHKSIVWLSPESRKSDFKYSPWAYVNVINNIFCAQRCQYFATYVCKIYATG